MKHLKEQLKQWFYQVNHNKYRHYFEEWFNNLTIRQIDWYRSNFINS